MSTAEKRKKRKEKIFRSIISKRRGICRYESLVNAREAGSRDGWMDGVRRCEKRELEEAWFVRREEDGKEGRKIQEKSKVERKGRGLL